MHLPVLERVEAVDYDVFSERASLSGNEKLALLGLSVGKTALSAPFSVSD